MPKDSDPPEQPSVRVPPAFLACLRTGQEAAAWSEFLASHSGQLMKVVRRFAANEEQQSDCFVFVCEHLAANNCRRLKKYDPNGSAQFSTWLYAVAFNLCRDWHRSHHPRLHRFRSISEMPAFDRDVFHLVYEAGLGVHEVLLRVQGRHPDSTARTVELAIERLAASLTPRQRELLQTRKPRLVSLEDVATDQLLDELPDGSLAAADPVEQAAARQQQQRLQRALDQLSAEDRLLLRLRYEKELTLTEVARLGGLQNAQAADRQIRRILAVLKSHFQREVAEKPDSGPCDRGEALPILAGDGIS
jgi:RNA polymerase sigma factor (sigma-70 family)